MKQITNREYEKYQQYQTDKLHLFAFEMGAPHLMRSKGPDDSRTHQPGV